MPPSAPWAAATGSASTASPTRRRAAGVVHFFWQGKAALWTPIYYGAFLGLLLAYRVGYWVRKRRA
jgi:hypothetical protein